MIIWSYDHMIIWWYDHMIIWPYDAIRGYSGRKVSKITSHELLCKVGVLDPQALANVVQAAPQCGVQAQMPAYSPSPLSSWDWPLSRAEKKARVFMLDLRLLWDSPAEQLNSLPVPLALGMTSCEWPISRAEMRARLDMLDMQLYAEELNGLELDFQQMGIARRFAGGYWNIQLMLSRPGIRFYV